MERVLVKLSTTVSVREFNRLNGMVVGSEPSSEQIVGSHQPTIVAITRICPIDPESALPRLMANDDEFMHETTKGFGPVPINPVSDAYPAYRSFMDCAISGTFADLGCEPFIAPFKFDRVRLADVADSTEIRVEGYNIQVTRAPGRKAWLFA